MLCADKCNYFPPIQNKIEFSNLIQAHEIYHLLEILTKIIVLNITDVYWHGIVSCIAFLTTLNIFFKWMLIHYMSEL